MTEALQVRSFKVGDPAWRDFSKLANEQGEKPSTLLRALVEAYVADTSDPGCVECGETDSYTVIGSTDLPVSDSDESWDGEAAKNRVWELCSSESGEVDVACVSRAFLYRDPEGDPAVRESYKLGFADVEDGSLKIMENGVYTAAGGHGVDAADIPEDEKRQIKKKICDLYDAIEAEADCPFGDPDEESLQFTLTGSTDLPVTERGAAWSGSAAASRVFDMCTSDSGEVDTACVSRAFLYRDPEADPTTQSAYKLGYADVVNGELQIIPKGVAATAGGRGVDATKGISDEEKASIKRKINSLYGVVRKKYEDWPENPYPEVEENSVMGTIIDPETGEPVLDDEGEMQDCSCDEEAEDYHPDCDCSGDDSGEPTEEEPANASGDGSDDKGKTAAIIGTGRLHTDTSDEVTLSAVNRVQELLEDGAVGVSVAMDMDPDTMPDPDELEAAIRDDDWDRAEELMAGVKQRLRHLAIVDTAAFSDCRMTMAADGTLSGPMTYEGIWTGDMRFTPFESVVWDSTLPIPIIWDREEGDHTGMTIGSITAAERVEGETSAVRDTDAAVASASTTLDSVPAAYFTQRKITASSPFTIGAPDANGLRPVYGLAAPKGVCHRSGDGSQCFQYPGDVDPKHFRGFHTGTALTLDNGQTIRVGALTLGGMHIDTRLAAQGVGIKELSRHREDANRVFALVRAYETPHGLAVAGVVVPGTGEKELAQARGCAPSVELWPSGRGRTLAGIHLVPAPAWPVAASGRGSALEMASSAEVVVKTGPEEYLSPSPAEVSLDRLAAVEASLARVEKALALLAAEAITDVPLPPAPAEE